MGNTKDFRGTLKISNSPDNPSKNKAAIPDYEPGDYGKPVNPTIIKVKANGNTVDGSASSPPLQDVKIAKLSSNTKIKLDKHASDEIDEIPLRTVHNINKYALFDLDKTFLARFYLKFLAGDRLLTIKVQKQLHFLGK